MYSRSSCSSSFAPSFAEGLRCSESVESVGSTVVVVRVLKSPVIFMLQASARDKRWWIV
uniref:Uncharacterized protein n=1 Tax=Arundo donax TaxID=35708 RepID=A0A0A9BL30_ARUDO